MSEVTTKLPVEDLGVTAVAEDGAPAGAVRTNLDGSYAITGLLPGTYTLRTSHDHGFNAVWYRAVPVQNNWRGKGAAEIDLATEDATGVDFSVHFGGPGQGQ